MSKVILITGGARSGKSSLAERLAEQYGAPLGYIATAESGDDEMSTRIARHQARRGSQWHTVEERLDIAGGISRNGSKYKALLLDCITLWLSNLLMKQYDKNLIIDQVKELTRALSDSKIPVIMVTNEVGMGIVPENRLAREFRDISGEANEMLAHVADEVYVVFSGLPLKIKG